MKQRAGGKVEGRIKRVRAVGTALFVLLILVLSVAAAAAFPACAAQPDRSLQKPSAADEKAVTMDVTYGYCDLAKGDRYLPVRVSLSNQGISTFSGTVELLTTTSSKEPYEYVYPVSVDPMSSLKQVYDIPLGVKADQIFATLRGADGTEVVRKRIKLNISSDESETLIGVYCDDPDSMNYLDGVGLRYGSVKLKLIPLTQDEAPEDFLGYDQMDLLMVTDYDLNRLSDKQQNAILKWVENGGTLLFGGGTGYKNNMGKLADQLLGPSYGDPEPMEVNLGAEYSQNSPKDAVLTMTCADLNLKDGTILIPGDGFPLLSYTHRGKGRIAAAAFDLRDMGTFCQTHPSFTEQFLTLVMGDKKIERLSQSDLYGFSNLFFSVQGLINTGNVNRLPNVILYTVVIVFYILLIGPVLYHLLKRNSVQRYYIGAVAACSLLFTAIIFAMGVKTRFRTPFFTYASVLDATDGRKTEETYVNVRSPYNKPYTVSFDPAYTIRPITKNYLYSGVTAPKFTGDEPYKAALIFGEDQTELHIRDTVAFTPKMFSLKKEASSQGLGILGDITFFDGVLKGTVTNQSDRRLEDAALLLYGKVVLLGDLDPGQTVRLDGREVLNYPLNYIYALAQTISGADQYDTADIEDKGYMLAQERSRLLAFYFTQNLSDFTPDARLTAFDQDESNPDFLAGGSFTAEGLTMITAALPVRQEQNGEVYRCALEQEPKVISGTYQEQYNSIYASESAVIEYALGNDIDVEKVDFQQMSPVYRENPRYPYLSMFQGSMYFYNYDTGHNDLMEEGKTEYTAEELKPYLSPDHALTIKYVSEDQGAAGWDRLLPLIYVTGREK